MRRQEFVNGKLQPSWLGALHFHSRSSRVPRSANGARFLTFARSRSRPAARTASALHIVPRGLAMKFHRLALGFPIVISSFVLAGAGSRAAADPVVGGNLATEVDAPLVTLAAVASGGAGTVSNVPGTPSANGGTPSASSPTVAAVKPSRRYTGHWFKQGGGSSIFGKKNWKVQLRFTRARCDCASMWCLCSLSPSFYPSPV